MNAEASTSQQAAVPADRDMGGIRVLVALAAIAFSAIYICSDIIELVRGGFSTVQLALTYAAEAAIPLFVVGLYAVQRPRIGRLGLLGALGYALCSGASADRSAPATQSPVESPEPTPTPQPPLAGSADGSSGCSRWTRPSRWFAGQPWM